MKEKPKRGRGRPKGSTKKKAAEEDKTPAEAPDSPREGEEQSEALSSRRKRKPLRRSLVGPSKPRGICRTIRGMILNDDASGSRRRHFG